MWNRFKLHLQNSSPLPPGSPLSLTNVQRFPAMIGAAAKNVLSTMMSFNRRSSARSTSNSDGEVAPGEYEEAPKVPKIMMRLSPLE